MQPEEESKDDDQIVLTYWPGLHISLGWYNGVRKSVTTANLLKTSLSSDCRLPNSP